MLLWTCIILNVIISTIMKGSIMDIKSVRVCAYSVLKRLQGYHLLQNPKGSSPYVVNMIKNSEKIAYNLDRFSSYTRISKDFMTGHTTKKYLSINRYMFWTDKGKEIKKERFGYKTETGKPLSMKETSINIEELNNRKFDYIDKKRKRDTVNYIDFSNIFVGNFSVKKQAYYTSIRDLEIQKFFSMQQKKDKEHKISFWSVLKANLNMK